MAEENKPNEEVMPPVMPPTPPPVIDPSIINTLEKTMYSLVDVYEENESDILARAIVMILILIRDLKDRHIPPIPVPELPVLDDPITQ